MLSTVLRLDNFRQERNMLAKSRSDADRGDRGRPGRALLQRPRPAARRSRPAERHEITVWERNAADDTFGFGVVFSDETLGGIEHADPPDPRADAAGVRGLGRHRRALQGRGGHQRRPRLRGDVAQAAARDPAGSAAASSASTIHFRTEAPDVDELAAHPRPGRGVRRARAPPSGSRYADDVPADASRCATAGTSGSAPTRSSTRSSSTSRQTPDGVMQIHGYPYDATRHHVHRGDDLGGVGAGRVRGVRRPRRGRPVSPTRQSIARIRELFADVLDGHEVHANNSRWISFTTVRNEHWVHDNVVLLGDAAHTAHFSIGSGTKLAMEDALALAACLHEEPSDARRRAGDVRDRAQGRRPLHAARRAGQPGVVREPRAVRPPGAAAVRVQHHDPQPPGHLRQPAAARPGVRGPLRRVVRRPRRRRGPRRRRSFATGHDVPALPALGSLELVNRVVVSPMDMYVADDGLPSDFHLVHLGGKALGGAGLVMTEMVCVSPDGRITPGCTGLWDDEQQAAWRRVTDFVHTNSAARIGLQLGHSGGKGSTKLMWEGIDQPLDDGQLAGRRRRPPVPTATASTRSRASSRRPSWTRSATSSSMPPAGAPRPASTCSSCTARTATCSPAFLSPVTNRRTDDYGGDVDGPAALPARGVHRDARGVARRPADDGADLRDRLGRRRPVASTTRWRSPRAFDDAGAAAIDVSTGQVTARERPAFGRSYQTPYADAIRNRLGVPTIAVGVISSYDDVNSILMAGRADLCALGRAHLYDPTGRCTPPSSRTTTDPAPSGRCPGGPAAASRRPAAPTAREPRLQLIREGDTAPGTAAGDPRVARSRRRGSGRPRTPRRTRRRSRPPRRGPSA